MNKFLLALGAFTAVLSINALGINANAKEVVENTTNKYLNTDVYVDDEGNSNTIYWASGIEAPRMGKQEELNNPKNPTKEGYFYSISETTADGHARLRYEYPTEVGKGYYDFNKNFKDRGTTESPLCYLVSASNILLWWMDQNMEYIEKYMYQLENEELYSQIDGAIKILPFDEAQWSFVHDRPTLKASNGFLQTELGLSKFVTNNLRKYYSKGKGSYPDRVFDLFINGYQFEGDIQNGINPNSENNLRPDETGGYFYPVFGNHIISKRVDQPKYSYYSGKIKELLASGTGITLTYKPATAGILHSVTLWGAEYDSNDNLTRVYLTDGDDPDNNIRGFDGKMYSRGLFSAEVRQDQNGGMYITDIIDKNQLGALVVNLTVLDLAQDIWDDAINHNGKVSKPEISFESKDVTIPLGAKPKIEVEVTPESRAYYSYQWYEAKKPNTAGVMLKGETNNILTVNNKEAGEKYYYCEVTKHKNGKKVITNSRYIKVYADASIPLIDAKAPGSPSFKNARQSVVQFFDKNLSVDARSVDGGKLSYQWYKASNVNKAERVKIEGATNKVFNIPTDEVGVFYYFPVVTNTLASATNIKSKSWEPDLAKEITITPCPVAELNPMASLAISYDDTTLEPTKVKLRLGARIDNSLVDTKNNEYGMIVIANDDYANIDALYNPDINTLNSLKKAGFAVPMTPKKVSGKSYSQFSWVIPNISKDQYDFTFRAYAYVLNKNTNELKLTKYRYESVNSVKDIYLSNSYKLGLSDRIIKVLEKI